MEEDSLFFKLCEMERQIDEKIIKKQNEMAASSFRSNKLRRGLKIYVSNSFCEAEGNGNSTLTSGSNSMTASNENLTSLASGSGPGSSCWILRIEGKIDQTGLNPLGSLSSSNVKNAVSRPQTIKRFSSYLKSLIVEIEASPGAESQIIEWNRTTGSDFVNSDGFEIRRPYTAPVTTCDIPCKIHLQFDFSPERFRLAPELFNLLNLNLATRPEIIVALWQYIKLHKLQESDEKKIINNDGALQNLFKVSRMSFSDIPFLVEPYLLPPEPVTISYQIRSIQDLNVLEQVFEVEVDVEDKLRGGGGGNFLPSNMIRDLTFYEGRLKELIEALHSSQTNHALLSSFAKNPIEASQSILKSFARDYETLVGDIPVTLDELRSSDYYEGSEQVVEAVTDFLALNPRFLPAN